MAKGMANIAIAGKFPGKRYRDRWGVKRTTAVQMTYADPTYTETKDTKHIGRP
ncbi:MAG: hypothetical protein NW220_07625 [Leptolyngbyaceae cyanobacterium bins.349]|nr:hypothetical protein [Leptolyngbyaceae cyanobacterium bins.349]